eukprot:1161645-Pelagomonas_calceolata.AAC.27
MGIRIWQERGRVKERKRKKDYTVQVWTGALRKGHLPRKVGPHRTGQEEEQAQENQGRINQ